MLRISLHWHRSYSNGSYIHKYTCILRELVVHINIIFRSAKTHVKKGFITLSVTSKDGLLINRFLLAILVSGADQFYYEMQTNSVDQYESTTIGMVTIVMYYLAVEHMH